MPDASTLNSSKDLDNADAGRRRKSTLSYHHARILSSSDHKRIMDMIDAGVGARTIAARLEILITAVLKIGRDMQVGQYRSRGKKAS